MRKLTLLLGTIVGLAAIALTGSAFAGKPPAGTCSGGSITGTSPAYNSFTVTGNCTVADGAVLTVNGNVTVADGASLTAISFSTVNIAGNVKVGKGAIFGLGCDYFHQGPTCRAWGAPNLRHYTVGGNIDANKPLTMYLDFVTVDGNVTSNGGGSADEFFNFVVKDNTIHGNLTIHGWQGGWWGVIRNDIFGNADLSKNASVVLDDGTPGVDPDSSEVQGTFSGLPLPAGVQHIHGNLICHGNTPVAQINPGDGGTFNIVDGNAIGECASLVAP